MPEGVVDALEVVEIHVHQSERPPLPVRGVERRMQPPVRLLAIRQPGQRVAIAEPDDVLHHAVELARQDGNFVFAFEVEPDGRIGASADCDRVAGDPGQSIHDRAIQENDQQRDDHYGGEHEVPERVVHRRVSPPCDLARHVDAQRQDGPAVNVIEGVEDLHGTAGLDQPVPTPRIQSRDRRESCLRLSADLFDLARRQKSADDHHASRRPVPEAIQHRRGRGHQDPPVGLHKALNPPPLAEIRTPGKVGRQRPARGEVQIERLVGLQVERRRRDKVPARIAEYQRADVQIPEAGSGHLLGGECLVVVLGEAPGVGPVSPAGHGQRELRKGPVQRELNAPHRHFGLAMLERREARHQHVPRDEERRHPQGHEQRGDERRDLRTDVHGPRFLTEDPPRFSSGTSRIGFPRIGLFKGTVTALTVDLRPSRPPCLRTLASPAPLANFLKVLAVADDVFAMLDQLVA